MLAKLLVSAKNVTHEVRSRIVAKLNNASGMEMLQMVIIIAIAVAIGALFFFGIKTYMPQFWDTLTNKIDTLLNNDGSGG